MKNTALFRIGHWTYFELGWLIIFLSIATFITIFSEDSLLNYSVLISGIFCVVLAAKGNLWTYGFGMYNSLAYAYVAYINGLFGEMGLNLFFFVPMNIVGFLAWRKRMQGSIVQMQGLPLSWQLGLALGCVLGILGLGWSLSLISGQQTPYIDATTNVLSVMATFLMVARYKEQWLLYIMLNIVTVFLWTLRLREGSSDALMMVVMWTAFLVNAGYGYYRWDQQVKRSVHEESRVNAR